jgi:hypothetical protein
MKKFITVLIAALAELAVALGVCALLYSFIGKALYVKRGYEACGGEWFLIAFFAAIAARAFERCVSEPLLEVILSEKE